MGWFAPVVGDHEGWIVPVFVDGAEGTGTVDHRGARVARRPGEEPHDGDRVLLAYASGSELEGTWQDGAVVLDEGTVHLYQPGEAELEVLDDVATWRPVSDVIGWVAGCECGWRARPWLRATAGQHTDRQARLLAPVSHWADLAHVDELAVMADWEQHVAPLAPLAPLVPPVLPRPAQAAEAFAGFAEVDHELAAVRAAKAAGASWADIARTAGITRRSARERWSSLV